MDSMYELRPDVSFRVLGADTVEALIPDRGKCMLPFDAFAVLIEFKVPRSARDVHAKKGVVMALEEFVAALTELATLGILRKVERSAADTGVSLRSMLRQDIFADEGAVADIGAALRGGRLVVVPDALPAEFAERVYASLDASVAWKPFDGYGLNFHYRHHNLYDHESYPDALKECASVVGSASTQEFMASLTGQPCDGVSDCSASWYQPGDHSLPHQDLVSDRTVAYVWHLTKDWESSWGGHFVWCPTGALMKPAFNVFTLFVVNRLSLHFVSAVASRATGKRLAVNGWFNRASRKGATQEGDGTPLAAPGNPASPAILPPALYGPPRARIRDVIIL
jgi:hypothetical protein